MLRGREKPAKNGPRGYRLCRVTVAHLNKHVQIGGFKEHKIYFHSDFSWKFRVPEVKQYGPLWKMLYVAYCR